MNNLENTGAAVAGLNASIQLGMVNKFLLAAYGLSAYAIGMLGVLAIAIAAGGLIPFGQLAPVTDNVIFAVVINIALTCLFGLQHSVMARKSFKRVFYTLFGEAGERSTFVWGSGVCALTMVYFWQPLNGTIWQAQSLVSQIILWAGFAFGWIYLVSATFAFGTIF